MLRRPKKTALEKELQKLEKQEERYIKKRMERKESTLSRVLDEKIPEQLQNTLDKAFAKAFALVFEKGIGVIEKTYRREEIEKAHKIRQYTAEVRQDRKSLKQF